MTVEPGPRERENLQRLLALARAEDLGDGDVTRALLPPGARAAARFAAREALVFCGGALLGEIAAAYDDAIETALAAPDGERAQAGQTLARWTGPAGAILSAERVALNFLQRLSGVATATRRYVDAVAAAPARVYDTRKTTPGWRDLEKYAVRAGGGRNHRRGLFDAVLVKDNHLAALAAEAGDAIAALGEKLGDVRSRLGPDGFVGIEVDTLAQLRSALALPVDLILLDNMAPADLARAVALRDEAGLRWRPPAG